MAPFALSLNQPTDPYRSRSLRLYPCHCLSATFVAMSDVDTNYEVKKLVSMQFDVSIDDVRKHATTSF